MITKQVYEQSIANGTLELVKGDEISRHVRKRYTLGAEVRIACNLLKDPTNPKYIAEFEEHEAYVDECQAIVDADIRAREEEYLNEIQGT